MALLSVFVVAVWALTPPATIFELDGDSATGSTYGVPNSINCDWDTLNAGKTANSTTPSGQCTSISTGGYGFLVGAPGEPNFATGGSKDSNDVSAWQFSTSSTPDKDTLTHGYAAAYTGPASGGSDNILVFGAERFAVNGDSNIGIWFFQQPIGITSGSKGSFTGVHTPGDILIVSAFSGGGGTATISVYEWAPAGATPACPNSNYPNISTTGAVNVCAATNLFALFFDQSVASSATSAAFAIVNNQPITLGWPYLSKFGGSTNQVPTGGFYEGGIDLTNLLGGKAAPCFASFLFETRSSQATNAVLKDFLVGSFPECHLSANKTVSCTTFNANGSFNYSYSGNVINDGGGDLFNVNVVDVRGQSYSCGNLPKGTSKVFGGSPLSADCSITPAGASATFTTTDHPASNQATATANTSSSGGTSLIADTGAVTSTDAAGGGCTPSPGLLVTKVCATNFQVSGGQVIVRVDYTGEVSNTGNDNLSNVNVSEAANGTPSSATFGSFNLVPGQRICYTNGQTVSPGPPATGCPTLVAVADLTTNPPTNAGAASYIPSGTNILATLLGRIAFSDTVTASGTDAFGNPVPKAGGPPISATAQCVICPFGQCATQ